MPQSLASVQIHVIFSTKNRYPFLSDRDIRSEKEYNIDFDERYVWD